MKALLLLAAIGSFLTASLNAAPGIYLARPAILSAIEEEQPAPIIAGKLDGLDDLIRGARRSQPIARPAYHYTQSEDKRRSSKGFLYYLMTGIWRLAVAGVAAGIAGSAAQKRFKDTTIQNAFLIAPFLIGLFAPFAGLIVAGVSWIALGGGSSRSRQQTQ